MGEKNKMSEFREMFLELLESDQTVIKRLRKLICMEDSNGEKVSSEELQKSQKMVEKLRRTVQELQENSRVKEEKLQTLQNTIFDVQRENQSLTEQLQAYNQKEQEFQGLVKCWEDEKIEMLRRIGDLQREKQSFEEELQNGVQRESKLKLAVAQLEEDKGNTALLLSNFHKEIEQMDKRHRDDQAVWSEKINKLLESLKPVQPWQEAYACYQQLPEEVRRDLQGIFKTPSLDGFMACGVQNDNIWALWEYAERKCQEGKTEVLQELALLLKFFVEMHNRTFAEPRHVVQTVRLGEEFDVDKHIRSSNSKPAGPVTAICLQGYENVQTKKIIKKTIVRV